MNHPVDLLLDLVDGSISERDRAVVEAHVAACERCRTDVELAAAGRDALRSAPTPRVPSGIGDAAIREAEERAREVAPEVAPLRGHGGRAEAPAWYRWAGAAAAVAAVLLVVVVALPNVGGDDREAAVDSAQEAAGAAPSVASVVEVQDADYDPARVQELALTANAARTAEAPSYAATDAVRAADAAWFDDALACLRRAQPALADQSPVRLIAARFEGTPAFLGVFVSGPGAGQTPTEANVWVAARKTCAVLHNTRAEL
jgi:hypothetical protein